MLTIRHNIHVYNNITIMLNSAIALSYFERYSIDSSIVLFISLFPFNHYTGKRGAVASSKQMNKHEMLLFSIAILMH